MVQRQKLAALKRSNSKASVIRRQADIPAIMYGPGTDTEPVQVNSKAFKKVWQAAGTTTLIDLELAGDQIPVLIRDIQMHPLREEVLHIDLYRVRMDRPIEAWIPLSFTGVSPAVKDLGGVLVRNIDEVEIKALPQNLPHEIQVDISSLATFEKVIHIKDLKLPAGVEVFQEPDEVVALVQAPRTEAELEGLQSEIKEDVESVEGVKKEEPASVEGEAATGEDQSAKK